MTLKMSLELVNEFNYFAFGSNLLRERVRLNSPSANFVAAACLDGYRLGFGSHWDGTSFATNNRLLLMGRVRGHHHP